MNTVVRSLLIGAVAGMRSVTPLAAISISGRSGNALGGNPFGTLLERRVVRAAVAALAGGELLGDKWSRAPDRTALPGLLARASSGALAAAALSPHRTRLPAALLGGGSAIGLGFASLQARKWAMRRFGQVPSGFVEDAIAVGLVLWLLHGLPSAASGPEPTKRAVGPEDSTVRSTAIA